MPCFVFVTKLIITLICTIYLLCLCKYVMVRFGQMGFIVKIIKSSFMQAFLVWVSLLATLVLFSLVSMWWSSMDNEKIRNGYNIVFYYPAIDVILLSFGFWCLYGMFERLRLKLFLRVFCILGALLICLHLLGDSQNSGILVGMWQAQPYVYFIPLGILGFISCGLCYFILYVKKLYTSSQSPMKASIPLLLHCLVLGGILGGIYYTLWPYLS